MQNVKACEKFISVANLIQNSHSHAITFDECVAKNILESPDSKKALVYDDKMNVFTDGETNYPIKGQIPILHSKKVLDKINDESLGLNYYEDPLIQYYLLSQIKHNVAHNSPTNTEPYEKHLYRVSQFCKNIEGFTLDVGCDNMEIGAALLSPNCDYIGIDPRMSGDGFRISSIAELLPFSKQTFDNVIFNTSLDHILDYHTAISEAFRVLKEDGKIIIISYVWESRATLLTDIVHFHHFRYGQIVDALGDNIVEDLEIYECPKKDAHRHVLMIKVVKAFKKGD